MEENSPTNSLTTVMKFYSNLADEVDQHFTRALHAANIDVHSQDGTQLPHIYEYDGKYNMTVRYIIATTALISMI